MPNDPHPEEDIVHKTLLTPRSNKSTFHVFIYILIFVFVFSGVTVGYRYYDKSDKPQNKYVEGSRSKNYPGFGIITTIVSEGVRVVPRDGHSFVVPVGEAGEYPEDQYELIYIPANDEALDYAVGYFKEWRDIQGKGDKLLVIDNPKRNNEEIVFRVVFEPSEEFEYNVTYLGEENTNNGVISFEDNSISEIGYRDLKKRIGEGDVIVVKPSWGYVDVRKDANGNVLASEIISRR